MIFSKKKKKKKNTKIVFININKKKHFIRLKILIILE